MYFHLTELKFRKKLIAGMQCGVMKIMITFGNSLAQQTSETNQGTTLWEKYVRNFISFIFRNMHLNVYK